VRFYAGAPLMHLGAPVRPSEKLRGSMSCGEEPEGSQRRPRRSNWMCLCNVLRGPKGDSEGPTGCICAMCEKHENTRKVRLCTSGSRDRSGLEGRVFTEKSVLARPRSTSERQRAQRFDCETRRVVAKNFVWIARATTEQSSERATRY
jgi:hypothetical protein